MNEFSLQQNTYTKQVNTAFRVRIIRNLIKKLSKEFGVDEPKLGFQDMELLHGFYLWCDEKIVLNNSICDLNLAEALRTVRHEFYHYLEDVLGLPEKRSELKAKRFEKGRRVEVLSKYQTKLVKF